MSATFVSNRLANQKKDSVSTTDLLKKLNHAHSTSLMELPQARLGT